MEDNMKYQLKKDLPFAKAGSPIKVYPEGSTPMILFDHINEVDVSEEFIPKLLDEGWIEEVKPREFWVVPFTGISGLYYQIVNNPKGFSNAFKVQEVL
jgi:hypothetical protein